MAYERRADGERRAVLADIPAVSGLHSPAIARRRQLVKMPVPRDESQIVFYRHRGDPQIVIRHRRTGAFELHESVSVLLGR